MKRALAIFALTFPHFGLGAQSPAAEAEGTPPPRTAQTDLLLTTNLPGILWNGFPAEQFYLSPNGQHLYLLTYVALYRLNSTNLNPEASFKIPPAPGTGMLSLDESPDGAQLAIYRMPGIILFLNSSNLSERSSCNFAEADYKSTLHWDSTNTNLLFALGDNGTLAKIQVSPHPAITQTVKGLGGFALAWDVADGVAYVDTLKGRLIQRVELDPMRRLEPLLITNSNHEHFEPASLQPGQIVASALHHRLFIQNLRPPGSVPPRDNLLVTDSSADLLRAFDVPMGIKHLQRASDDSVFYGQLGPQMIIWALPPSDLQRVKCASLACDDFVVDSTRHRLYFAKYNGHDAKLGVLHLVLPP